MCNSGVRTWQRVWLWKDGFAFQRQLCVFFVNGSVCVWGPSSGGKHERVRGDTLGLTVPEPCPAALWAPLSRGLRWADAVFAVGTWAW